ncbi:MAG: spore cortex biosynthesis protein YabQ [Lachnospiraceae bacterium]|nr:spore cortex biosynthesis protein YabQ [Lachnospiraceae bacterium]
MCDLVFWGCTAVLSFRLMHRYSNGMFRWYAVGAAFLAMWLYGKTVERFIRKLSKALAGPAKNALTKLKRLAIIKTGRKRKEADTK